MRLRLAPAQAAIGLVVIGGVAIGGAWFVQVGLGVPPCDLCLKQRWPYYAGLPLALVVLGLAASGASRNARVALGFVALVFAAGLALAAYHAGIEHRLWPGPADCTGASLGAGMGDFLSRLETTRVVRCDDVGYRLLFLSLADWNVIVSGILVALALAGALARLNPGRARPRSPRAG